MMFVTANVRDQIVARFFCGSFSAEKFRAHVVIHSDDTRPFFGEAPHGLRSDQTRRTCDDDRAHYIEFIATPRMAGTCLAWVCSPLPFRKGERIKVRGSQREASRWSKTLTQPSPSGRERRKTALTT